MYLDYNIVSYSCCNGAFYSLRLHHTILWQYTHTLNEGNLYFKFKCTLWSSINYLLALLLRLSLHHFNFIAYQFQINFLSRINLEKLIILRYRYHL